jgi:hypothetical protein
MIKTLCLLLVLAVFISACGKTDVLAQLPTVSPINTPEVSSHVLYVEPTIQAIETNDVSDTQFFDTFVESCKGNGSLANCLYVNDDFALRLYWGNGRNISAELGTAQLYDYAWNQGRTVGILAHDYAEGKNISSLSSGTLIYLIYPSGEIETYLVESLDSWTNAGEWKSFTSSDKTQQLSSIGLEDLYYLGGESFRKMVLQTCINGNEGVMFVTAFRVENITYQ